MQVPRRKIGVQETKRTKGSKSLSVQNSHGTHSPVAPVIIDIEVERIRKKTAARATTKETARSALENLSVLVNQPLSLDHS